MLKSPNNTKYRALQWLISLAIGASILFSFTLSCQKEVSAAEARLYVDGVLQTPIQDPNYPSENKNYSLFATKNVVITTTGQIDGSLTLNGTGTFTFGSDIDLTGAVTIFGGTLAFSGNRNVKFNSIYIGEYNKTQSNPVYVSKWEIVDGKSVDNGYYISVTTIIKSPHIVVNLGNSNIQCFAFVVRGGDTIVNPGNSSIITTLLQDDSSRIGHNYKNVTIVNAQGIYGWIEGKSSFTSLLVQGNTYICDTLSAGVFSNSSGWVKSAPTDLNRGTTVKVNNISLVSCK